MIRRYKRKNAMKKHFLEDVNRQVHLRNEKLGLPEISPWTSFHSLLETLEGLEKTRELSIQGEKWLEKAREIDKMPVFTKEIVRK